MAPNQKHPFGRPMTLGNMREQGLSPTQFFVVPTPVTGTIQLI
jgi:hypothetical protein